MDLKSYFKRIIIYKSLMLVLIIIWGGMVQISNTSSSDRNDLTELGGLLFTAFSVVYFFVSYQLYKFKPLGKKLFTPLAILFIVLGFLGEIVNPIEVDKKLYYLFVFYIVSPIFFAAQGVLLGMLYFSKLKAKFEKT